MPPACATLNAAGLADAARGSGDQDRLAVDRALEAAGLLEQVGIEVALPVVPELVGVALEAAGTAIPDPSSARSVSRVSNWAVNPT